MEAHHPHHVTRKKKWQEFLVEFFMLFLAMFPGFVAESICELNVEPTHEKEYAEELYKKLYTDSIAFVQKINARLSKERGCDYMYAYIKDSSFTNLPKIFILPLLRKKIK